NDGAAIAAHTLAQAEGKVERGAVGGQPAQHRLLLVSKAGLKRIGELGLQKRVAALLAIRVEVHDAGVQILVAGPVDAAAIAEAGTKGPGQRFVEGHAREELQIIAGH
nr:hypothetical protein [Tanacetum cinerariifolium]